MTIVESPTARPIGSDEPQRPAVKPSIGASPPQFRRFAALIGLAGVVIAEILPAGHLQALLAGFGLAGLFIAAALLLFGRVRQSNPGAVEAPIRQQVTLWRWTLAGLGFAGALVCQTWFQSGTVVAGGDIAPPIGTAWIGRIFSDFGWSGDNLGGPATNQGRLVWGVVSELTHLAGGSGALAQRIWLTLLVAGIMVATGALARSLGLTPLAGLAASILYFFNPMTVSQVGVNDVYLVTMAILAALPTIIVSYGRGNIRLWMVCIAFVVAAPFVGYSFANPPLVGMLAIAILLTPLLVRIRFGGKVASRSLHGLLVGGALLIGASAYWLIPAWVGLSAVASGQLSTLSAWAFTESRSTLANGLWLNTTWGWQFSLYYPYAPDFGRFPLDLVEPLLPLLAFGGLVLRSHSTDAGRRTGRLVGLLALGTIGVIFLSTGTRAPGNVLFDPLYNLPLGWLLREPGRFLMVAALGYALLVGLLVEQLRTRLTAHRSSTRSPRDRLRTSILPATAAFATVAVAMAAGFPLWTGALVPAARQGFPSSHVKVPNYWTSTASYLNSSSAPKGALLVLPPDDFYQMPYTWYYGSDAFIPDLFERSVVVPSAQGYDTVSTDLLNAVSLEASSIEDGNWGEGGRLLAAIGTPLVLVRGDIVANFENRDIVSPKVLASELARDPDMRLVHRDGPLSLYELRSAFGSVPTDFATVNTTTPDLNELGILPVHTALVTSKPQRGHTALFQFQPVDSWHLGTSSLTTSVALPAGWTYSTKVISAGTARGASPVIRFSPTAGGGQVARVQAQFGRSLITDGNFSTGTWGPVGNCDAVVPVQAPQKLNARIISHAAPGGAAALQLSATVDSACTSTPLSWSGGAILLSLSERSLRGTPASLCVWEVPVNRCADTTPIPAGDGWHRYTTVIEPDPGTSEITLFLYANSLGAGDVSTEEYSGVVARTVPGVSDFVVLGTPTSMPLPSHLVSLQTSYSALWSGPSGASHVIVDGMWNGWISSSATLGPGVPSYLPIQHETRSEILLAALMLFVTGALVRRRRKAGILKAPDMRAVGGG